MQSFSRLYQMYYKDIYHFLLKLTCYHQDLAEELTQDTFYHAIISFSRFRGDCQIKTWLIQIAKNRFYTYLRKSKKNKMLLRAEVTSNENLFGATSPHEQVENRELISNLLAAIESLDARTRDIILYRFFTDLSYSQIATIMKISEGSAKVVFCRGKAVLHNRLREVFGYEI